MEILLYSVYICMYKQIYETVYSFPNLTEYGEISLFLRVLKKEISVTKNTGEIQPFSKKKLVISLKRSGASEEIIREITNEIEKLLYPGIPTRKIYRTAFNQLRKKSLLVASQYKLKEAIMELGPSGYPFELLIGKLFERMGYKIEIGAVLEGACVQHEVDVLAKKENMVEIIECKFHNRSGLKSDVKVPLYINSRYQDIINFKSKDNRSKLNYRGWVVTNTRFTDDAHRYAVCAGLLLMGWDYPENNNLKVKIGASGLYPVTVFTKLTRKEKASLIENGIIFCEDIIAHQDEVKNILRHRSVKSLLDEAANLLGTST